MSGFESSARVVPMHPAPQPVVGSPTTLIPEAPAITKRTYASAMSYVGSARRTTAWIRKVGNSPVAAGLSWSVGVAWIATMWFLVLPVYYFFTLFIFGWFMIPFRLVRRSHRKQEHLQQAQLATMQQMMVNQQVSMMQQQASSSPGTHRF